MTLNLKTCDSTHDSINMIRPHHCRLPRMSFLLLSKAPIWFLMDLAVWDFAAKTPDGLLEQFVGLPVIGKQFVSEILPRLHFRLFHREVCELPRLNVPRMQRRGFVPKPCLAGYFRCLNNIFSLFVPTKGYFFAIIRHTDSFPSAHASSRWSYRCFEQTPLHLNISVRCAFWKRSQQRR